MDATGNAIATWDPLDGRKLEPPPDGNRLSTAWRLRDALSARMLVRALQEMGAFREPGRKCTARALADELGVVPVHRGLWEALLEILTAAGLLKRDGELVRPTQGVLGIDAAELDAEGHRLAAQHPEVAAQLRLIQACLSEYPRLMRGETKPLSVLFPGWSMELVENVYRGDPVSDRLNELAAEAVAARIGAHAGKMPPQVLEIGAGTGGSAARILATTPPGADGPGYTYTDISASFLRHGRDRFGALYDGMEFKRLDIEGDTTAQGFPDAGFDVAVAANVLHATRNLRHSLAHVRRLLRPDGWLVLREITAPLSFTTMTFGLLEGWWLSEDGELRIPRTPLANVPTWRRLLTEAGFGRIAVLAPAETGEAVLGQHIVVAEL